MKLFSNKCCYTVKVIVRDRLDGRRAWTKENTRIRVTTSELLETLQQAQDWIADYGFTPAEAKICRVIEEDAV